MKKLIIDIEKGSIAEEIGVQPQDLLLTIDGAAIADVFDYRMACAACDLEVLIEKPDGEQWLLTIEKDEDEDLGLVFKTGLMDDMHPCCNNCVFCFVHQNPPNMRSTIYFRDDDYRLSFLHGNYITMTNMTQADVDRVLAHRLSPMNISVHTTDPSLRVKMMGNSAAGDVLGFLKQLADGGITLNMQIVLCKNYNDGTHLDKTILDLSRLVPDGGGFSLSVVPAGLTKYRKDLPFIEPFSPSDCRDVVKQIEKWQHRFLMEIGGRFVFAADEFYIKAELPLPEYEHYEDFPQIENGVGMCAAFRHEVHYVGAAFCRPIKQTTIATGMAAADFMKEICSNLDINVIAVRNDFFGENVTVAGLLTGQDIVAQLKGQDLGELLLLPACCLRHGEEVFLDDMTLQDMEIALGVKVLAVGANGADFAKALYGRRADNM
ncbi:MAG: DUF512 domain-containing protein [Defluviitaleaceae bacterium]|nr:DUF512 domain-containing protein [Defluviitaleaceae bacterium]